MYGDSLERGAVDEEVVHAGGVYALEEIVRRKNSQIVFELRQFPVDLVDKVRIDRIRQNGVPVFRDTPQMPFDFRFRAGTGVTHGPYRRDPVPDPLACTRSV